MEYVKSTELYHHGVLGQKWGKRNGPPYPLKPNQHSAAEKKAGWQKSVKGGDGDVKKKKSTPGGFQPTASQKKAIDVAVRKQEQYLRELPSLAKKYGFTDEELKKEQNQVNRIIKALKSDEYNSAIDNALQDYENTGGKTGGLFRKKVDAVEYVSRETANKPEVKSLQKRLESPDLSSSERRQIESKLEKLHEESKVRMTPEEYDNMVKNGKTGSIDRNDWSRTEVAPGSNPKSPRAMSDSELKEYNARAGMEKKYTDYTTPKDNSVQNANYVNQIANATRAATDNIQRSANNEYNNAVAREKAKIDLSNVSDAELRQAVNRMNLERQYRDLTPVEIKSGEEKFKAAMDVIGPAVATAASVATIASVIYAMTHG